MRELAHAAALVLPPGYVFSGMTAAHLLGLWTPRRWHAEQPVEAIAPGRAWAGAPAGIRCGRGRVDEVVHLDGLRVSAPGEILLQLAHRLPERDLVVLAESMVRWRSGLTLAALRRPAVPGRRGNRRVRRALARVREGSASAGETLTRLWLVDGGLPEPELNAEIVVDGHRYYGDLVWRDARVIVEYHGAYHFATPQQQLADLERLSRLRRAGWVVIEVTRSSLVDREARNAVVDEVARALGIRPRPLRARGRTMSSPVRRRAA